MAEEGVYERNYVIAAAFADKDAAKRAASTLKENDFPNVWLGTICDLPADAEAGYPAGEAAIIREIEVTPVDWTQRVFGEGTLTLHDIVIDPKAQVGDKPPKKTLRDGEVILTVDVPEDMQKAMEILGSAGGHLLTHDSTPGAYAAQEASVLDRERRRSEEKIQNAREGGVA